MSEWINCNDRLPALNQSVGYTFDGVNIRTDVYHHGDNGSWEYENSLGYYVSVNVTHWIPRPKPPRECNE